VRGLSLIEAERAIAKAYRSARILAENSPVSVNLMRKRTVRVAVIGDGVADRGYSRRVTTVDLPSDSAEVLSALAESGARFNPRDVRVLRRDPYAHAAPGTLQSGDVVDGGGSPQAYYIVGGALRGGRFRLPSSGSIDVVQAIAAAGGQLNGPPGLRQAEVVLTRGRTGATQRFGVNWLVNHPGRVLVEPGDTLWLQYY
jgi:hypothetical protein